MALVSTVFLCDPVTSWLFIGSVPTAAWSLRKLLTGTRISAVYPDLSLWPLFLHWGTILWYVYDLPRLFFPLRTALLRPKPRIYHTIHRFKVYNSTDFSIFKASCSHTTILECFQHPRKKLYTSSAPGITNLLSDAMDLPILDVSHKWNHSLCGI